MSSIGSVIPKIGDSGIAIGKSRTLPVRSHSDEGFKSQILVSDNLILKQNNTQFATSKVLLYTAKGTSLQFFILTIYTFKVKSRKDLIELKNKLQDLYLYYVSLLKAPPFYYCILSTLVPTPMLAVI